MSKDPEEPEEGAMTLWEHLAELRSRMVKMIFFFIIGFGVAWYYKQTLLDTLTVPYAAAFPPGQQPSLHFSTPASGFIAMVKLAALSGLVFSLPLMMYQLWAFIAPGLYAKEKRFAIPFVLASCLLFAGGAYFCFEFAFPPAFKFLIGIQSIGTPTQIAVPTPMPSASAAATGQAVVQHVNIVATVMLDEFISFITNMMLAFGFAAELPIVAFFLSVIGVVTHKDLIKFFRYWVVIAFVISAVVTPPDPLSQFMLAVPLCGLYGISILVAWVFGKKKVPAENTAIDSPPARS
ncbi:MAG TPA: twin-arginine translocase subunit TatC [Polyangiaceae bacterium]|jgi:sec-independent protein translocase protein TatC|nr:twin-arginine translocase subunit TatC [Polyangiaceae bacterium]